MIVLCEYIIIPNVDKRTEGNELFIEPCWKTVIYCPFFLARTAALTYDSVSSSVVKQASWISMKKQFVSTNIIVIQKWTKGHKNQNSLKNLPWRWWTSSSMSGENKNVLSLIVSRHLSLRFSCMYVAAIFSNKFSVHCKCFKWRPTCSWLRRIKSISHLEW